LFTDFDHERRLVLETLNEDYDEQGAEINAYEIARGLGFEAHPLGQRITGPRANVERFSIDDIRRHFATFYGARNANLCVAGPVEHGRVVEHAARAFAAIPVGARVEVPPAPPPMTGPHLEHVKDTGSQTTLSIVFRALPELDPAYIALIALLR